MNLKATFLVLLTGAVLAAAQQPPPLTDPFLDHFVGEWRVQRVRPNGKSYETSIRGEWVLQHHFIELHYGYAEKEPQYEARVFIGWDESKKSYVCHWVDVFGGNYSLLGHGKLEPDANAIEFRFGTPEPEITNKMTYDPQTKSWASLIRQVKKGEWTTFLEEKWTKADAKN